MADFILLMHDDSAEGDHDWAAYLAKLRQTGQFAGGSGIGDGACYRKSGVAKCLTDHIVGYIRVEAENLEKARALLAGNPVYEGGGTVEIRELPKS